MSQHGGYDQALLDEAPVATRAQRQEGYNVDLLDTRPSRPLSTQPISPPLQPIVHRDTDVESSPQEKFVPGVATYAQKPTQSFWRTRNGKITILVIVVLVLGAVIGGAVGGSVGKKKNSNDNTNPASSTSTFGTPITSLSEASTPVTSTPATTTNSSPGDAGNNGQTGPPSRVTSTSSTVSPSGSVAAVSTSNLAEDS